MNKAIVVGSTTTHGGQIEMGESRFKVDGKPTHLEGMTHFCPKCKIEAQAVSGGGTPNVFGKRLIVEGDKATCGATFISSQTLLSVERVGNQSATTSLDNKHSSDNNSNQKVFDEQFLLKDGEGNPLCEVFYSIKMENGKILHGITDGRGYTKRYETVRPEMIEIYLGHIEG